MRERGAVGRGRGPSEDRVAAEVRRLQAVSRLAAVAATADDAEAVHHTALEVLVEILEADGGALLLADAGADGAMRVHARRGLSAASSSAAEGSPPWAGTEPAPQPVLVAEIAGEPACGWLTGARLGALRAEGIGAVALVPLVGGTRLLGQLVVAYGRPHDFSAGDGDLCRTVAGHVAGALERHRLEAELRAVSDELAAVLNAVGEGITVQAPDGRLVWANEAAARLMGFASADELLATPLEGVLARFEIRDEAGAPLSATDLPGRRALAGEEPPEVYVRWRVRATGVERWSLVRARPVRTGGGPVRLAVNVLRDVTDEQRAHEALVRSEERFAFLASASRALLGSSLDTQAVAVRVTDVAVPALADQCSVWALEEFGGATPVASRHVEDHPAAAARGAGARRAAAVDLAADRSLCEQVRRGQSVVLEGSTVVVPVHLGGVPWGALVLANPTGGRPEIDLGVAEDLSRRAGQALSLARAYESEQREREAAEAAQGRLELLSDVTRALTTSLDSDEVLRALERRIVPTFADYCAIDLVDPGGGVRRVTGGGSDHCDVPTVDASPPSPAVGRALQGDTTVLAEVGGDRSVAGRTVVDARSALVVPITGRSGAIGAITFVTTTGSGRRFGTDDVALAEEIGRRAGVGVDNARLFSERSAAAATLTQALLPASLPEVPGMELAARYRPAAGGVGGDFYDVLPFGDGQWLLIIADVCGKGAEAASFTALARYTLRTLARHHDRPAALLEEANQVMVEQMPEGRFCTVVAAAVEPAGGQVRLRVAAAGHPLPLVVRCAGELAAVGRTGMPLGLFDDLVLPEDETVLGPGDALVLFTDGCVGEGGDAVKVLGPRLTETAGAPVRVVAKAVEAGVGDGSLSGHRDDITVLAMQVRRSGPD